MTNAEYLDELNNRLMAHPDYRTGMRFVTSPPGSTPELASGYTWERPGTSDEPMRTIAQLFCKEVGNG